MKKIDFINLFSEYQNLDASVLERGVRPCLHHSLDSDSLLSSIFAPDPVTGTPRSDLFFIMSADAAPEVSHFIRDTLLQSIDSASVDDPDFALESVKSRFEDVQQYADRLKDIISRYNKTSKSD